MSPNNTAPTLKLLTVNVNGMGSERRVRSLMAYQQLAAESPDFTFVQEAKVASREQLAGLLQQGAGAGSPWVAQWAFTAGTANSRGTAILARKPLRLPGYSQLQPVLDTVGRRVCWDWDVAHLRFRLISIYAPTMVDERGMFFSSLRPHLETDRLIIMGGDFNCVLRNADEQEPSAHRRSGTQELQHLQHEFGLVDPWVAKGHTHGYTHPASNNRCSAARLDRWLISEAALQWVRRIERKPGAPGDHHGVLLELQLPDLPKLGRRGWSFPTYLLFHPGLLPQLEQDVHNRIQMLLEADPAADARDKWEAIKGEVRTAADGIHRRHIIQRATQVKAALNTARAALAARDITDPSSTAHWDAMMANHRLVETISQAGSHKQAALEAAYSQQGERGSSWFHRLGREIKPAPILTELLIPGETNPRPLNGPDVMENISASARAHYSSDSPTGLFRVGEVDEAAQEELLGHISRRLPEPVRLTVDAHESQGLLAEVELVTALSGSANGKAPGSDGLPYELYKALWKLLGPHLLAALECTFHAVADLEGATAATQLPQSWLEGLISLIYKGWELPRALLQSYRPITLLNCDYKLVGKAINNRLQPALSHLISELQTAFAIGRWIGDNVLYHQALAEWLQATQQPGALLLLDIQQAYDRVHRQWLYKVVRTMGFGPYMQRWIRLLTADGQARLIVNGHASDPFPVRNGLQQGSTLSPVLWVLQLEPLTAFLRHLVAAGSLHTPYLPDGTPASPVSHHADDTTLLVSDVDVDGLVAKQAVLRYCQASNARENASKAKGITLGTHRPITGTHAATQAIFPEATAEPPRHLGIPLGASPAKTAEACYSARIGRMKGLAAAWRRHNLSMVGRVHVAKQVMGNALAYHFTFVRPTPPQLVALRQTINGYVAWSLLPEDISLVTHGRAVLLPEEHLACLDTSAGGIGHIHLEAFQQALQAKALAQLACPGEQPWKVLHRALLQHYKPEGTTGWGWIYGAATSPPQLPERLAQMVQAFRATQPQRIPHKESDDPRVLLHEPLFYNPSLVDPATAQPFVPPDPIPPEWPLTVGQLRVAPEVVQQQPIMGAILGAAPASWKVLCSQGLLAPQWPLQPTWRLSPDGAWAASTEGSILAVQLTGRMVAVDPLSPIPQPSPDWKPACIVQGRKPRLFWTPQERLDYEMAPMAEKAGCWPLEHQVLGTWEQLQCFPSTYGHGNMSLLQYSVSNTRRRATVMAAEAKLQPETVPVIPAAWKRPASTPGRAAGPTSKLQTWEASWQAKCSSSSSARFSQLPPEQPSWLTATAALRPVNRNMQPQGEFTPLEQPVQEAPQPQGPGPPEERGDPAGPWRRLWDCPASNRAKVLGWRLQHGRLPCGLYLASKSNRSTDRRQFCPSEGCQQQHRKPRSSLTHTFVQCPAFAQARQWLQQTWTAITGKPGPPVENGELMLGDRQAAWADYPSVPSTSMLWQVLRLTFLHAIWIVQSEATTQMPSSETVVRYTILELQRLMRSQFRMAALSEDTLNSLPLQLITAQLKETQLESFKRVWAAGNVLCSVATDPGGKARLVVYLSMQQPVAAPGQVLPLT